MEYPMIVYLQLSCLFCGLVPQSLCHAACSLDICNVETHPDVVGQRFKSVPDIQLLNNSICSFSSVLHLYDCVQLCKSQLNCVSFTYDKKGYICSLHNSTLQSFSTDTSNLVEESNILFFQSIYTTKVRFKCRNQRNVIMYKSVLERVRTRSRTQWVSPSPSPSPLGLWSYGVGLGLGLHLCGLGLKRCGLGLWSYGLGLGLGLHTGGLGLTVSPVRNVEGKFKLSCAIMDEIRGIN